MKTLRNLVSGTDFSECAEQALDVAIRLASAAAARVTVVHVYEFGADDLDDRRLLECGEALSRVVARHRSEHVELAGLLRCGNPWEKLDSVAAEVMPDAMTAKATTNVSTGLRNALFVYSAAPAARGYFVTSSA